jgi:hypothetical protein
MSKVTRHGTQKFDGIAIAWNSDKFIVINEEHVDFDHLSELYDSSFFLDNWG